MKITKALMLAQNNIYPIRFGSQWVVTKPWEDVGGPSQHGSPTNYRRAQLDARMLRAELALKLMGFAYGYQYKAIQDVCDGADWRDVVRKIVRKKI